MNTVHVLDLSLVLPAMIIAGVGMVRQTPLGVMTLLGAGVLVQILRRVRSPV